ncbi:hypothetical protein BVY03_04925 [bacterium K02(2017)]|nr:hypothetical protein BVY03_04925 [bacterium K02(2017)]
MPHKLPKGFTPYIITESLGAFNDNFFKMLLQLYILVIVAIKAPEELISIATLVFTIPFVIFGPWAGYLADKFSKTKMMQVIKVFEILIMAAGVWAFYIGNINYLIFVLFLMATQSAFFSPCKAGFIPESCSAELITKANSLKGMSTFVSIILGTALGGILLASFDNRIVLVSALCIIFAKLGTISSFFITKTPTTGTNKKFPLNFVKGIFKDLIYLKKQRGLFLAALASSYFWLLGLVFQTNILVYGTTHLGLTQNDNALLSILPAAMGIGIALGSLLASRWSGNKIEIGLLPLGGAGLCLSGILLFLFSQNYYFTLGILFFAGISGGLYIIPLDAYLQFNADEKSTGRVIATAGVMSGGFLVLGSLLYRLLAVELGLSPAAIYLVMGILTALVTIYICTIIPEYFLRFLNWLLSHTFYKIKIIGADNLPLQGPALLCPNHVSFVDSLLISATTQRFVKFILFKKFYEIFGIRQICNILEAIPIAPYEGRESVMNSLNQAKALLSRGELLCIFPEGALTRDGEMKEFKTGLETIMADQSCPIIPAYMDNLWGSIFSFETGKAFWKLPKKIPYPVTIIYGEPLPSNASAQEVRDAVEKLRLGFENSKAS